MPAAAPRAPRRPAPAPAIRCWWDNPPAGLTLERYEGDRLVSRRHVGPRGRLELEEAAAVLERSIADVQGELHAGFLRAVRGRRPPAITVDAARAFLAEERRDVRIADAAQRRIRSGRDRLIPLDELTRGRRALPRRRS